MAHSGILDAWDTPPFSSLWVFSYRSLRIRPGKHSVWCQGVTGGRNSTVRFGSPFDGHRDIPSRVPSPQVSPFVPKATRPDPPKEPGNPSPSQRPLRGGGIMANFRHEFCENGRD